MEEVSLVGEVHGDSGSRCGGDDLFVAHRASGLNNRCHSGVEEYLESIGKREKRVTRGDAARRSLARA